MYRLMVVDDESFVRRELREAVDWQLLDIDYVGEAENGLTALAIAAKLKPDILICDIRMPKLDGIALVNELYLSQPNLQVLFLSGYSDTEYLRTAIRLDAVDYIFKPFTSQELIAAIEKAKRKIKLRQGQQILPQQDDLALQILQADSSLADPQAMVELPLSVNQPVLSIVIRLRPYEFSASASTEQLPAGLLSSVHYQKAIRDICEVLWKRQYVMSCIGDGYVIHANVSDNLLRPAMQEDLQIFFNIFAGNPKAMSIGVGRVYHNLKEIRSSYMEARAAEKGSFLLGSGQAVFFADLGHLPFSEVEDIKDIFCQQIQSHQLAETAGTLDRFIDQLKLCRVDDIPQIKDRLVYLAFWLSEQLPGRSGLSRESIAETISQAADLEVVRTYLAQLLQHYADQQTQLDSQSRSILEAEQYIRQHYAGDLSIKAIAHQVFLTPNYLCYLYKKKRGQTIYKFITDLRMSKAADLLKETDLSLEEITRKVGYANSGYFSRLFTRSHHINPRDFRSRYQQGLERQSPEKEL